mgnify:CR=1 FL=1
MMMSAKKYLILNPAIKNKPAVTESIITVEPKSGCPKSRCQAGIINIIGFTKLIKSLVKASCCL